MKLILSLISLFCSFSFAQNICPQISEAIQKTCGKNPVDLCDVRDELLFQKYVKLVEKTSRTSRPQFEKYKELLKGPATKKTLLDLESLRQEVTPCQMESHAFFTLMLKQGATKSNRQATVQNLIRKKLLAKDGYSFTWDSLRERVSQIQEAMDFNLLILSKEQQQEWTTFMSEFKTAKSFSEIAPSGPNYSEKGEKLTPNQPVKGQNQLNKELTHLNELFVKVRQHQQRINDIFQTTH